MNIDCACETVSSAYDSLKKPSFGTPSFLILQRLWRRRRNASVAGTSWNLDERVSHEPSPTSSEIWLTTETPFFRGYNQCFTPCLITTRVQKLCTKSRKVLSPFRRTFRLRNIFSLLRALLLEPLLPGRDHQLQILCSFTLMRSRNTVRHCPSVLLTLEGLIIDC